MSELKLQQVAMLNEQETVTQIIPFGQNSLACLTSSGRVLIPGPEFAQWFELPIPPIFSTSEH